jgi:hypothetical protein
MPNFDKMQHPEIARDLNFLATCSQTSLADYFLAYLGREQDAQKELAASVDKLVAIHWKLELVTALRSCGYRLVK